MSSGLPDVTASDSAASYPQLRALGEVLDSVSEQFTSRGALGLLLVDGEPLREIERSFGQEAFAQARSALGELVETVAQEVLGGTAIVACGETGRCEVIVMVIRSATDGDFFTRDLPALERLVRQRIQRQGQRIGYPYLRQLPALSLGWAMTMRNPLVAVVTELRSVLEEARSAADLDARLAARERRLELMELIICGRVYSVYEPIVDARSLTVFGYEALARGNAGSALSAPLVLFGLAEKEGLTFQLDCLCRQKAIEGAIDFPSGAKLFMNIRPSSFHDPSFQPDALKRTLGRCGLGPKDVVFEISEQESISNYEVLREARDFYGHQGFQFALDDTGAGHASLEAVMELGPEFIKVDRAFVHGIDEDVSRQYMVEAFRNVAERMNARIIGEGLTTLEELKMLDELGIDLGQGWLFGKPTPLRGLDEDDG